jgi:hypothetical protein
VSAVADPEYVLPAHPDVPGRDRRLPDWPPLTEAEKAAVRAMAAAAPKLGEVEAGDA